MHALGESGVRGAVSAAAAVLGVPIELHDGVEWRVVDGVAHVGLGAVVGAGSSESVLSEDEAVARVLLLLWESVREARVAPARRRRRLALAAVDPHAEPLLAAIDRLLAAAELLAALPSLRVPVARVLVSQRPPNPGELSRHLQWVIAVLDSAAARWATGALAGPAYADSLAPEVAAELAALDAIGARGAAGETRAVSEPGSIGETGAVTATGAAGAAGETRAVSAIAPVAGGTDVLLLALSADPKRSPMQRFERAYGLLAPPYERLREADERGRGPLNERGAAASPDDDGEELAGFDSGGGGATEDASDAGEGGDATTDGETEAARAGDKRDGAEGADLFAAEQAGFVASVLSTPLPAAGAWAEGLDMPDVVASDEPDDPRERQRDAPVPGAGGSGQRALASYRERVRSHAASIDKVREVWRRIVSERVHERRAFSRLPEADGDMLDRRALVSVVAQVAAGIERPRAFLARQRRPRRTRREGSTDYVLLIDRSASMQGIPAQAAATAALIMLEALAGVERDIAAEERALGIDLELSLRTALIVFDSTPHVVKPLAGALDDRARQLLDAAIHSPQGSTNDAAALRCAAQELGVLRSGSATGSGGGGIPGGDGLARQRVVILVSDGGTNDAPAAAAELARLRAAGATVIGIGIRTDDIAVRFAPGGVRLDSAEALPGLLERLVTGAGLTE